MEHQIDMPHDICASLFAGSTKVPLPDILIDIVFDFISPKCREAPETHIEAHWRTAPASEDLVFRYKCVRLSDDGFCEADKDPVICIVSVVQGG